MRAKKSTSIKTYLPITILTVSVFSAIGFSCGEPAPKASSATELRHYDIKVSDLPPPEVQSGPRNQSRVIPKPEGAQLTVPAGFNFNVFASGLNRPFGLAIWKDYLYVGNTNGIVRFKYKPGQTKAEGEPERLVELP